MAFNARGHGSLSRAEAALAARAPVLLPSEIMRAIYQRS